MKTDFKAVGKWCRSAVATLLLTSGFTLAMQAAETTNTIVWHAEKNTLDVDIDNKPLAVVVADFKKATGREIHVPPGMSKTVSLKFADKPMSEGLAKILDGFNYYSEPHGETTRIVIVDPNGTAPAPVGARPVPQRMPLAGATGGYRPSGGPPGGPGNFGGSRTGDPRSGGSTKGGNRPQTDVERAAMELIMREAGMKGGGPDRGGSDRGGSDRGGYSRERSGSSGSGTSSSGKSRPR